MHNGTTVAAAKRLNMSQSAVSNAIKSAELSLGFTLFDRTNKRLVPTEEACLLLEQAEALFLIHDIVEQTAEQLRNGRKGRIHVVATSELSESLLPRVLRRFLRERPEVSISLDTQRLDVLQEHVETGLADVGFAMEPHRRPALRYFPLATLDVVCACPQNSPLSQLPFVTPSHLRDVPLINTGTSSRLYTMVHEAFQHSGIPFAPTVDVRFMNIAGLFVEEGLGVAIMDQLTASSRRLDAVCSVPFRPRLEIEVDAIVTSSRPVQRLTQALIQQAQDAARQLLSPR